MKKHSTRILPMDSVVQQRSRIAPLVVSFAAVVTIVSLAGDEINQFSSSQTVSSDVQEPAHIREPWGKCIQDAAKETTAANLPPKQTEELWNNLANQCQKYIPV